MNYERIYSEFIADRRSTETALKTSGCHFEKHHVMPKKLGGMDDSGNMIALTPEDHFFAHLLLAKTHGGRMWAPIAFMVGGNRKDYKPTVSRIAHGWAARAMAAAITGDKAYQFDAITHRLVNADGLIWEGLQSAIPTDLGVSKSLANMLIKGRISVAKGWSIVGTERKINHKSGTDHPMHRDGVHEFCHVDGRTFTGTQFEFAQVDGMHRPAVSKLVSGKSKVWNGWHLKGAVLPIFGRGAKWGQVKTNGLSITDTVRPSATVEKMAGATC